MVLQFFEKGFRFPENLFQSWSIENVQNFHWLSYKNMPISQMEGFFWKFLVLLFKKIMFFLLALKSNLLEKTFPSVKTKTNSNFAVKLAERINHSFLLLFNGSNFSNICTLNTWWWNVLYLIDCVNIRKRSEAAKQPFLLMNWVKPW